MSMSPMDGDTDWCYSCERRVESGTLYCSPQCTPPDQPQEPPFISTSWRAHQDSYAAIDAWLAAIPLGAPPPNEPPLIPSPLPPPGSSPPNLLKAPRRPVPPTLSMSSPAAPMPGPSSALPAQPRRQHSGASLALSAAASLGQTSRCTPNTESSAALATPPPHAHALLASRRPSVISGFFRGFKSSPRDCAPAPVPRSASPLLPPHARAPPHGSPAIPSSYRAAHQPLFLVTKRPPVLHYADPSPPRDHPSLHARGRKASRAAA